MNLLSSLARRLFPMIEGLFPLLFSRMAPGFPQVAVFAALYNRLRRTLARFDRLAHRWQTNTLLPPKKSGNRPAERKPRETFSTAKGWLLDQFPDAIRHHIALYNARLQAILTDPEMQQMMAELPRAAGMLRPLCQLLAVAPPGPPPPKRPRKPRPRKPRLEKPEPHQSTSPWHLRLIVPGIPNRRPKKITA